MSAERKRGSRDEESSRRLSDAATSGYGYGYGSSYGYGAGYGYGYGYMADGSLSGLIMSERRARWLPFFTCFSKFRLAL